MVRQVRTGAADGSIERNLDAAYYDDYKPRRCLAPTSGTSKSFEESDTNAPES
jgi:hypothetical protein